MIPKPSAFIGIDWSGAKGPYQQGIQTAYATPGNAPPQRIDCPVGKNWGREAVFDWLMELTQGRVAFKDSSQWYDDGPILVGIDFAFAHPFIDESSYYPGLSKTAQPCNPVALWQMIDQLCEQDPHLYGGRVFATPPLGDYYLSPHNHRAPRFASRRRMTDHAAQRAGRSPSSTFKAIGADNVATGSMAGMRLLHRLKSTLASDVAIWPFDDPAASKQRPSLIIVEIFPSLYFHAAGLNPARNAAANPAVLSEALAAYDSEQVPNDFQPRGKDADEADAMISAAALRYFSREPECWSLPVAEKRAASIEGWIFGVNGINNMSYSDN